MSLQSGADLMYYKVEQKLLQNRVAFLYYQGDIVLSIILQSGASGITKLSMYYKMGQLLLHSEITFIAKS